VAVCSLPRLVAVKDSKCVITIIVRSADTMNQLTRLKRGLHKNTAIIITALAVLFFLLSAPVFSTESGQAGDPISIGVLANRGYDLCLQEWGPTAEYLSAELAPLHFVIVPLGFDEIFAAVSEGHVSYIAANPSYYAYLEYYGLANRIATLQLPGEPEPQPLFGGVIFARSDRTEINALKDLEGRVFAAVDENSLGGWHAALREIIAAGLEPEKDFKGIVFSGTHDQVALAVLNGEVDAGTVRSSQLERMSVEGLLNLADLKIINDQADSYPDYPYRLSTALYPEWPFAALATTDSGLNRQVAVALLMMNQQDPAALAIRGAGWAVAQDYGSVHELLEELSLPPYDQPVSFTLTQVLRQYWGWIGLFIIMLLLSWGYFWRMALMSRKVHQVAEELKASEAQSRALIAAIPDMLFRYDREGNYLDVEVKEHNLMMIKTRDLHQKNALVGKNISDVLPPQIAENLLARIKRAIDKNSLQEFEYSYEVGSELKHFESRLVATGNSQVVSIVRDITAEKSFNDELKYVSYHDPLTGLYNRSYFESEIERLEGSREYPILVVSVDLDGLKLINDTFGHKQGDEYLIAGANI
jgi:ABC-type phosphate/phosphonate transport system substrate-binding protein